MVNCATHEFLLQLAHKVYGRNHKQPHDMYDNTSLLHPGPVPPWLSAFCGGRKTLGPSTTNFCPSSSVWPKRLQWNYTPSGFLIVDLFPDILLNMRWYVTRLRNYMNKCMHVQISFQNWYNLHTIMTYTHKCLCCLYFPIINILICIPQHTKGPVTVTLPTQPDTPSDTLRR